MNVPDCSHLDAAAAQSVDAASIKLNYQEKAIPDWRKAEAGSQTPDGEFMPTVTEEEVLSALKSCYDPEIPVNIVDLGLIYKVNFAPADSSEAEKQDVSVEMTLTSPGCPEHVNISAQVKSRLEQLPGVRNCAVNVVWTPAWTPERLSPEARKQLGIE
jgi:metal-sulfur cluster biosynthetic enzyme